MSLVPSWAPNIHPFVIHFPIVLIVIAAAIELMDVLFDRPAWLGEAATSLYIAGAVAAIVAYFTGLPRELLAYPVRVPCGRCYSRLASLPCCCSSKRPNAERAWSTNSAPESLPDRVEVDPLNISNLICVH
jgi:hypothetical protein